MGSAQSSLYDGQQQLAAKLASKQPLLLAFMSPQCNLCKSLRPSLIEVGSTQVAILNALEDKLWAPEMLAFNIETIPCIVLLDSTGRGVCKSPQPHSQQQMEAALREMSQEAAKLVRR